MWKLRKLRGNQRGALPAWLNTPLSVVLIAAITTGVLGVLSYLSGYTEFTPVIVTAGVLTGVMEGFTFYQTATTGVTITVKTLGILAIGAVYVGVQALVGLSSYTVPALLGVSVLAISYFLKEISAYLQSPPASAKP